MYRPLDLEDTGADYPTAATLRSRVSGWTEVSATEWTFMHGGLQVS